MLSSETLLFPTQQHKKQERPFSSLLKAAFFIGLSSYDNVAHLLTACDNPEFPHN